MMDWKHIGYLVAWVGVKGHARCPNEASRSRELVQAAAALEKRREILTEQELTGTVADGLAETRVHVYLSPRCCHALPLRWVPPLHSCG